ncbi:MAG: Fe-S cluster assembly ATPase SufC [Actinobacteria bacterium]|nr:Fe-S cluster assembly ATPase SufC [Actinomycetota bacterium]MCL5446166.1 Fe-S cluster assembly ATPase SufC [Actinomycetota bacterium]
MALLLQIKDLHAGIQEHEILHGVNLQLDEGEVLALMGPNGSGKSTLANVMLGSPEYEVTSGQILYKGEDVTSWAADVRAKAGMFMAFQHPEAVEGLPVVQFLRQAMSARRSSDVSALEVRVAVMEWLEQLGMDPSLASRHLNEGFSGGERKRNEVLQMALLDPDLAILDETDSGLDVDGIAMVAKGVNMVKDARPSMGVVMVTHYAKFLEVLHPEHVAVLVDGAVVASGGDELATEIDRNGYDGWK